jgi:hypothetical protein
MELISFLKGMRIEDNCPFDVTFRTSRSCGFLGFLLSLAGLGLGWQVLMGNRFLCFWSPVALGLALLSSILFMTGLLVISYRKSVTINRAAHRIDVWESSFFCRQHAVYDFQEVVDIEIYPLVECFGTSQACMWNIKAYLRRGRGIEAVRVFSGIRQQDAEDAAQLLSQLLNRRFVTSKVRAGAPRLSSQVSH